MKKNIYVPVAEGVLRGFVITVVLLLLLAVAMTFTDISESTSSIIYLITTVVSIMYGSLFAVKKAKRKGWLIGIMVALLYMTVLYFVSVISGNASVLGVDRVERLGLALIAGALSGMLAINL